MDGWMDVSVCIYSTDISVSQIFLLKNLRFFDRD